MYTCIESPSFFVNFLPSLVQGAGDYMIMLRGSDDNVTRIWSTHSYTFKQGKNERYLQYHLCAAGISKLWTHLYSSVANTWRPCIFHHTCFLPLEHTWTAYCLYDYGPIRYTRQYKFVAIANVPLFIDYLPLEQVFHSSSIWHCLLSCHQREHHSYAPELWVTKQGE